jgi:hypothetical protein
MEDTIVWENGVCWKIDGNMSTRLVFDTTKPIMGKTICSCCGEKYEDGEIFVNPFGGDGPFPDEMGKYCILVGLEDWVNGSHGETPEDSDISDREFWLEEYAKSQTTK